MAKSTVLITLLATWLVTLQDTALNRAQNDAPVDRVPAIETEYDSETDTTTARLLAVRISGEKEKYYGLKVAASFKYPGKTPRTPQFIDFELRSIVKARRLNPDLYVVLLVDGETLFLSSNRSAIKNPVPGRRMIGERIVMHMPYATFLRIARASKLAIKMDATVFEIGDAQLRALREFGKRMTPAAGKSLRSVLVRD